MKLGKRAIWGGWGGKDMVLWTRRYRRCVCMMRLLTGEKKRCAVVKGRDGEVVEIK